MVPFSVCMAVYGGDLPEHFISAVKSIYHYQSLKPNEIIVVVDGPIPDKMEVALNHLKIEIGQALNIIRLKINQGHAIARQTGIAAAQNEIIALMDADDISLSDRFEKQIHFIANHPEVVVVGGQIAEFIDCQTNIVSRRIVPCNHNGILKMLKGRCPFNQMSITMRRSYVNEVGGYKDWYCDEDYYLWIRMAIAGFRFANLPDTLVNVRVGKEMYQRRGGWQYFRSEAKLQTYMFKHQLIGFPRYIFNVSVRFVIQVALPNSIRGYVFQKLFRK